jgi:vesicle coat complex subunit
MQTEDLEQKKLVYLYLMNYAKTQPELVILAVNTFVKDTDDPNPLVRALAIRTMGCLRAEKIIDYLCDPLQKCLRDENPYVRKTAALCVAKLYDLKPELVIDNGFLEQLQEMISDSNPMVRYHPYPSRALLKDAAGCCQYDCSIDRHTYCCYVTTLDIVLRSRNIHNHRLHP